ncbi:MAG: carbonic anhydrase family protein, partial [Proteobacteria bacterium]|nr:carbonic anhydrase family protein [Pseudomonadota bacterium]
NFQKKLEVGLSAEKILEESLATQAQDRIKSKATSQTSVLSPGTQAGEDITPVSPGFGYSGSTAPWRWMDLKPAWELCGKGRKQSPIDISGAKESQRLKPIKFNYRHDVTTLDLAASTLHGKIEPGSWLEFDADRYDLKEVYFRTPGEHRINGLPYELELQLAHEELSGRKLILSVQFTTGKSHPSLRRIAQSLPRFEGETVRFDKNIWSDFLPSKRTYWTYTGSLTMPPCTEDVTWVVLTQTSTASTADIDNLAKYQKDNARPYQPLNGRKIARSNR